MSDHHQACGCEDCAPDAATSAMTRPWYFEDALRELGKFLGRECGESLVATFRELQSLDQEVGRREGDLTSVVAVFAARTALEAMDRMVAAPVALAASPLTWDCPDCGATNGDVKEQLAACRGCGIPRDPALRGQARMVVAATRKLWALVRGEPDPGPPDAKGPPPVSLEHWVHHLAEMVGAGLLMPSSAGDELFRMVLALEWAGGGRGDSCCPRCGGIRAERHRASCDLDGVLTRLGAATQEQRDALRAKAAT